MDGNRNHESFGLAGLLAQYAQVPKLLQMPTPPFVDSGVIKALDGGIKDMSSTFTGLSAIVDALRPKPLPFLNDSSKADVWKVPHFEGLPLDPLFRDEAAAVFRATLALAEKLTQNKARKKLPAAQRAAELWLSVHGEFAALLDAIESIDMGVLRSMDQDAEATVFQAVLDVVRVIQPCATAEGLEERARLLQKCAARLRALGLLGTEALSRSTKAKASVLWRWAEKAPAQQCLPPNLARPARKRQITKAKANERAKDLLKTGKWTVAALAKAIPCATGLVSGLPVWQEYRRRVTSRIPTSSEPFAVPQDNMDAFGASDPELTMLMAEQAAKLAHDPLTAPTRHVVERHVHERDPRPRERS